MEALIEDALGLMSPEEQVKALNAMDALKRSGFFHVFMHVHEQKIIRHMPVRVLLSDSSEMIQVASEYQIAKQYMEAMSRVSVPAGEKVVFRGTKGLK